MTHTCDDDSDTEINLSFNGASSITGDDDVHVANENIGRPETGSKSESLLSSPIEGWDLSPDGVRTSEGLETSIAESKINVLFLFFWRILNKDWLPRCIGMAKPDLIPESSAQEERDEERNWRSVVIMGLERKIDLKVIEPYKKVISYIFPYECLTLLGLIPSFLGPFQVLSHGGYQGNDCQTAVIVFSACFLPDRSRVDYDYVMEHLFLWDYSWFIVVCLNHPILFLSATNRYVLTTLDQLVAEDYVLIYFHGATPKSCIPRFSWVKNCYQMIDRRLRKNLKRLYLVHPTLWLKAAVLMCRPFIRYISSTNQTNMLNSDFFFNGLTCLFYSTKFSRKIMYIPNLPSLSAELPMDHVCIPDRVKQ